MIGRLLASILFLMIFAAAVPALAQEKPVTFNIGVGPIMPQGDTGDRFDTGVTFPIGVTFNINENVGIQGEYSVLVGWVGRKEPSLNKTVTACYSSPTTPCMLAPPTSSSRLRRRAASAATGSLASACHHRSVELTTPAVGLVTVCDPWRYVCYPAAVPVDQVIGSRSTTDFGINFGGAITFAAFFVEVRYHYVWGPEIDIPAALGGGSVKANGHYLPIIFGVRF